MQTSVFTKFFRQRNSQNRLFAVGFLLLVSLFAVEAQAAPSIAVSYAPSQNPFVVGQAGQSYKLSLTASGGPITSAMPLVGALPTGIVTSGAITTTAGTLVGCPAAGAMSLAGCVLSNVPNGTAVVTIPVAVNPSANSAFATGQVNQSAAVGCTSPGGTATTCPSQAAVGILDAVNDAVTVPANTAGTFDLSANDKSPTNSPFSLGTGSTCTSALVSSMGIASYTSPAAGQSCTVNYKRCNGAVCDTALLTVTTAVVTGGVVPTLPVITHVLTANTMPIVPVLPRVTPVITANMVTQCGSANGVATASAPTGNLCAFGTASTPTQTGASFTWMCTYAPITASCSAPLSIIVKAMRETVNAPAGSSGSANVRSNDTVPSGSLYSLAAGSTCSAAAVSTAGIASYTAPAAGQNCSVNYTVCNSGQCDSAILTVIGTAPLVQAVNDIVTTTAGTSGTFNVSSNDTAPSGSAYSLAAGSTCGAAAVSTAGIASYTAPAAGQSCSVIYTVCNTGQCSSATLTVTATAPVTYTIGVAVSGLPTGTSVVLNNNGGNPLTVTGNGASIFSTSVTGAYAVSVATQPVGANCVVTSGSGTATANVVNIPVVCTVGRFALVLNPASGYYDVSECVKDTVTGLIWEGKTVSGGRAGSNTYSNYDDVNQLQLSTGGYPTMTQINAATNSIGYKNMVNTMSLCGANPWRMPTLSELQSIVDTSAAGAKVSPLYFPNTGAIGHWTSSPIVGYSTSARMLYFQFGSPGSYTRNTPSAVRLVR